MTDTLDSGDRIFLRGLTGECIIGFIDWERRVKQTVVLDIEMPVDCARAARERRGRRHARLQEGRQARARLRRGVRVQAGRDARAAPGADSSSRSSRSPGCASRVNKPGAIRGSRDVGVTIERTRADLPPPAARAERAAGLRRRRQQHRAAAQPRARGARSSSGAFPACASRPGTTTTPRASAAMTSSTSWPASPPRCRCRRCSAAARHRDPVRPAARCGALGAALDGPGRAALRGPGVR